MDRHAEAVALASQVFHRLIFYLNVLHNQVLASSPHSVEALVARAKAHRAAEQLPEALQDLALAHDLNPTNRFLNLQFEKELTLARHDNRPALSSQMHIPSSF